MSYAFATAALFTDVAYWFSEARVWAQASAWLLWGAFWVGVVAAVLGAVDYFGVDEVRGHRQATQHGAGNTIALALLLLNAVIRIFGLEGMVVPWGVALSVLIAGLLAFTGYLGGELSYKHLIGANPHASEPGTPLLGRDEQ
jgi:uncharacterized membrane protein